MTDRWLSIEEIAAHLGVNPDTIYERNERNKMPVHEVGEFWRFLALKADLWVKHGRASERRT